MLARTLQNQPVVRDRIQTEYTVFGRVRRSEYSPVSPLLRLPVIEASASILAKRFDLVKDSLEDEKALSKWLINACRLGITSANEIPVNDPIQLRHHAHECVSAFQERVTFAEHDIAGMKRAVCWAHINKKAWCVYAREALKKGYAAADDVMAVVQGGDYARCLALLDKAQIAVDDVWTGEALKYTASLESCIEYLVDLRSEIDSGKLSIDLSEFYAFGIDSLIGGESELAMIVRNALCLISYLFCPIFLPSDYADMYLNGWSFEQESLDVLDELGLLNDIDDLSDAIGYLEEHQDTLECCFDLDEGWLRESVENRATAKKDFAQWSCFENTPENCFSFIESLDALLLDSDLSDPRLSWLSLVVHAFRAQFHSLQDVTDFITFRQKHVEGGRGCQIVALIGNDFYGESVIQPLFESYMGGGDDECWLVEITSQNGFEMAMKYMACLGIGAGLIKESWIKNDSLEASVS